MARTLTMDSSRLLHVRYFLLVCLIFSGLPSRAQIISSPDKKISVHFSINAGRPTYTIKHNTSTVLNTSNLGIERGGDNFFSGLKLVKISEQVLVRENYTMVNAKKHNISYQANRRVFSLRNASGKAFQIIFQVSNDGVVFRYHFPGREKNESAVTKEFTEYRFSPETKTWLQPKAVAQSGWEHSNPSYEEDYYQDEKPGRVPKNGWVYPALFKTGDTWALISEAGMDGTYCGTSLTNDSLSSMYSINFPDRREIFTGQDLLPKNVAYTPWRIITIGSLKTIIESTLGTDVANPSIPLKNPDFIKPGKSSWSWIMSKDENITYDEQIKYIDLAAKMNWQYCLIDVNWDTKIGLEKIKELVKYAAGKKVGLILWYNSAGAWNTVPYHPNNKMLTHADRGQTFSILKSMGVKGVKIDFFNGDGRSMIQYYTDILKDAARYDILVNFHGATLPRGWARTYPNLMSAEAVKGFEMITFEQRAADHAATHCAMLPFTRNAFDPMDFTPMNLYKIQSKVVRKTTSAFELATSVLFLSGIQHYAESPDGMAHVPDYVQSFLRTIPNYWDDVRFIDGFPGRYAVIARKKGSKWYIAGINGEASSKKLRLPLADFKAKKATLITDGNTPLSFVQSNLNASQTKELTMQPNGGFVMVLE